ncbi:MAG: hypothetical protein JKX68_01205 [Flavobacteriales bacterium]|nr:hypothetical protein [Flavobacteriales bacterium]
MVSFYNTPNGDGDMGYGNFSMNLLAPFDARGDWCSTIMPGLEYNGFQVVEGFQYLGLGIIVLYAIISLLIVRKEITNKIFLIAALVPFLIGGAVFYKFEHVSFYQIVLLIGAVFFSVLMIFAFSHKTSKKYLWLFVPAFVCIVLALSHNVYLGSTRILRYSIFEEGLGFSLFQTIRASGRLFWVASLIFLVLGMYYLFIFFKSKSNALFILILCVIIQSYDVINLRGYIKNMNSNVHASKQEIIPERIRNMVLNSKKVDFLNTGDYQISFLAVKNKIPVNSFFMAHGSGILTKQKLARKKEGFEKGTTLLNDSTIYFVKVENDWNFPLQQDLRYYKCTKKLMAITTPDFIGIDNNGPIITKIKSSLNDVLKAVDENKLVIIAVKDEASTKLPAFFSNKLDLYYGSHLSALQFRESYIAVFSHGKLIHELFDMKKAIHFNTRLNGNEIEIISGSREENIASIKINGIEYSQNKRGLNIVTLDSLDRHNTLYFDTYGVEYKR